MANPSVRPKRVFISYSQYDPTDPEHTSKVLMLAHALVTDGGLDVELDQFHKNEIIDWPIWCQQQLEQENSDYVLMVCTAEYLRRVENKVPAEVGRGVFWEGGHIAKQIYRDKANKRFLPILLGEESENAIPRSLEGWTWFRLLGFGLANRDMGYRDLYRLLTGQPAIPKPQCRVKTLLPPEIVHVGEGIQPVPGCEETLSHLVPHARNLIQNLPSRSLNHLFKGRDEFLRTLREAFLRSPKQRQAIIPRLAIHGLGGIGKTRAAVEYAWRYREDYTALLFLKAETALALVTSLANLCPLLGLAAGVIDDMRRAQEARQWLLGHPGWLLIVDNVDDEDAARAVEDWLGNVQGGHVLLTGRIKEWPADVLARRLDVLDRDSAAEFLLERGEGGRRAQPDDAAQALALADELDGLALALEQAAAFIRKHGLSFAEYLTRWREADRKTRAWHDARVMQYPRPLATTWQTSVDTLPAPARALLDVLAWLGSEPIPRFLFDYSYAPEGLPEPFGEDGGFPARVLAELFGEADVDPEEAFAALRGVSLLRPGDEAGFANEGKLHKVLALLTRERQDEAAQAANLRVALALVDAVAVGDSDDVRVWPVWEPLEPLVRAVADFGEARGVAEPTVRLLNELALMLKTKALHGEAEPLYRRSLALAEQGDALDHSKIATIINNLAALLLATNRLEEAEPLMRRALDITEAGFGPRHPKVAIRLNNLAQLLQDTNRLEEAEPLMRRALDIAEASFGPRHPDVAIDLNNLARLLQATNRVEEAEPLMRRHLVIFLCFTRATGHAHPHLRAAFGNYRQLLQALSLDEAAIGQHLAALGPEAGYGEADYARLLAGLGEG